MTRKTLVLTAGGALALAAALSGSQSQDALDPVRVAPETHKVAFENMFVRVLEVRIPPGSVEPRHRHPHGLSVYLTDWDTRSTIDGQPPQTAHRTAGTFVWSDAVVHTVQNVGTTEGHVLRVELKR